jgi:hypothetical protein
MANYREIDKASWDALLLACASLGHTLKQVKSCLTCEEFKPVIRISGTEKIADVIQEADSYTTVVKTDESDGVTGKPDQGDTGPRVDGTALHKYDRPTRLWTDRNNQDNSSHIVAQGRNVDFCLNEINGMLKSEYGKETHPVITYMLVPMGTDGTYPLAVLKVLSVTFVDANSEFLAPSYNAQDIGVSGVIGVYTWSDVQNSKWFSKNTNTKLTYDPAKGGFSATVTPNTGAIAPVGPNGESTGGYA